MKKDLKSMAKDRQETPKIDPKDADAIRQAAKKYEGKSEAELLGELKSGFDQGKISPQDLENFSKRAGTMLNDAQKKKLQEIMRFLKK